MIRSLFAAALLLAAASAAGAEGTKKIFKCTNAQMNSQGVAVKQIDRLKTPEELAADQRAAAAAAELRREQEARNKADLVLLLSYPGEADLLRAHNQELESVDGIIKTTELSIASHEKSLAELLAAAADAERAKQPVPATLTTSIDNVRRELETQRALIERKSAEKAELTAAYETRLARFRELKAKQDEQINGKPKAR